MLTGFKRTIPKGAEIGVRELAKFSARTYSRAARAAGIRPWRGKFFNTLDRQAQRPTKTGKRSYGVSIASLKRQNVNYFISLDRMRTHKVAFKKGRIITKWAQDPRKIGLEAFAMSGTTVEAHPFIRKADGTIKARITKIVKKTLEEKLRRKGRG